MTRQSSPRSGPDLRLIAVVFAIAAIILVWRTLFWRAGTPFFVDTDDAMRMVMVTDFIHGQNWYDLTNHRLNTPFGAEIHWSRLVDLPLTLLVMGFTPLLGADTAIIVAGYIWPLLLLGVLLWLSAKLAYRLVGPEGVLPALVLPLLSPAIIAEFTPGRVDHHNVVILLTLATAWAAVEAVAKPRFAWLAGALAATALAIAVESLPAIAAAIIVFSLLFVFDATKALAMRHFGMAFGASSLVHLAVFRPTSRWLEPACDVISPFYVGIAVLVGAIFTLVGFAPGLRHPWQRLLALGVPGLAGLAGLLALYPQCLKGPYGALEPWLQTNWIANIQEAKPWLADLAVSPAYAIAVGVPALLATIIVLYRLWRVRDQRAQWAVLLVFLLATALVMLAQIRGSRLAILPAIPAGAWLIVTMRQRYLARAHIGTIVGLLGSWLAFSGFVLAVAVNGLLMLFPTVAPDAGPDADTNACRVPAAFADLAGLPPAAIMSPIDLGAHILLYTPHSVVAAPYHRNQQGVRDAFRFFNDPIDEARQILRDRAISLVVLCPGMPEVGGLPSRTPDSFASLYAANNLPAWLTDVSLPGSALKVYAVAP